MVPFGKYPERGIRKMGEEALWNALNDAGARPKDIQTAYCGNVGVASDTPMMAAQIALEQVGILKIPVTRIENACGSGSNAFRDAWLAIQSGIYDVALAFGIEKMTKMTMEQMKIMASGGGGDKEMEGSMGFFAVGIFGMAAHLHMDKYGTTREQIAKVSVKNHFHGSLNPLAQYGKPVTVEEVIASRPISDPLNMLDCCPFSDGAAAAILVSPEAAKRFSGTPVRVLAAAQASGTYTMETEGMVSETIQRAAQQAYEMSGLGPEDIDVAEVHDCFTIAEITHYEDLGFCKRGEGGRLIEEDRTTFGGRPVVNPSGGLLSKGHPLGATGVAQICEIVQQLRGKSGKRQVEGARIGLTHNGGGFRHGDGGCTCVHIFEA
jgi:acetyl-CoA acetyltransferase